MPTATLSTAARPPALAEGVELIGEYEGSGFKEPPSLVRRADGQVIQLPGLLYAVAAKADGRRSYDDIAEAVSGEIQRGLSAEQVQFLANEKLRPLGVWALPDGSSPEVDKPDPFLALKFRMGVVPERLSAAVGTLFKPLFLPPVLLVVLAAFVVADVWLFFEHGVAQALRQSILHPGLFLPMFALVVVGAAFHEAGHAAGCRYGGGRPGRMGCGLYLAWPAFYTDVTDAYRLGRRARLRTDLGGIYFNIVIVLATVGAYFATHFEPLLLFVVIEHFEIAHQLLPVIRLDGYYIVADITGVPDLFARIGPILRSALPWRKADDKVRVLKRWVRAAVTAWVFIVVPLLLFELLIVLIHLPRIVGTAWQSAGHLWHSARHGMTSGDPLGVASSVLQIVVLAIPVVGILLMLWRAAQGGGRWLWRATDGKPVRRGLGVLVAGAGLVLLAMAWVPRHNYKPIQPGERGTIAEGAHAVSRLPSGSAPLYSQRRAAARTGATTNGTSTDSGTTATTAPGAATSTTTGSSGASSDTSTSTSSSTSTTVRSTTTTTASTTTTAP
jgi:putative peptide zinc metalloprotease protein